MALRLQPARREPSLVHPSLINIDPNVFDLERAGSAGVLGFLAALCDR
jgi:hypothetical protein